jgi:DNA-binding HxlR family transcriptional regulator
MNDSNEQDGSRTTPRQRRASRTGCAVEVTLSVIGGVWKPVILFHLLDGKLRFNALNKLVSSATPRMLTLQLRELEADGIVQRTVFPEVPPRVEYALSDVGRSLEPILLTMRDWGELFRATMVPGEAPGDLPDEARIPAASCRQSRDDRRKKTLPPETQGMS